MGVILNILTAIAVGKTYQENGVNGVVSLIVMTALMLLTGLSLLVGLFFLGQFINCTLDAPC